MIDLTAMTENATQATRMWMDFMSRAARSNVSFDPRSAPGDGARQVRSAWFDELSEMAEQFMRTPQFLEMMKHSMDATTEFRSLVNEFMTAVRHDSQGVAREDIDALMVTVRRLSSRVLDRMDEIDEKLDALCERMEAWGRKFNDSAGARAETARAATEREAPTEKGGSTRSAKSRRKPRNR